MGQLIDRDQEHLRLLTWGYYVFAAMSGFFTLIFAGWVGFIGLMMTLQPPPNARQDAHVISLVLAVASVVGVTFGLSSAVCMFLTGRWLAQRRHRIFCFVTAGLICLQPPWGTAIGVCTFIVLNRPEVKSTFDTPAEPGSVSQAV